MHRKLLNLSLLAVVAVPLAAHAQMDQITVTGTGLTYTYIVPVSPTVFTTFLGGASGTTLEAIELNNVPLTTSPGGSSSDSVYFATTVGGGGFFDANNNLNVFGPPMFNDSATSPTFLIGSGTATDGTSDGVVYDYSITAYTAPSPAPEPSSLILLGTGALGLAGAFRRRIFA